MNGNKFFILFISLILFSSTFIRAMEKYGDIKIKKGTLSIIRLGDRTVYTPAESPVIAYKNDVLRTGKKSSAVLTTPNKSRMSLGSNAILQLKKWKKYKKTGSLRMLFGKFRARTVKNNGPKGLNILTSTAVIGVKGSLAEGVVDPDVTSVGNLSGEISMSTSLNNETDIPLGQLAYKIDDNLSQLTGLTEILNYIPNVHEDKYESNDLEKLDSGTKNIGNRLEIQESDLEKIKPVNEEEMTVLAEVTEILPKTTPPPEQDDFSDVQEKIDAANKQIENVIENENLQVNIVKVNVTFEK